MTTHSARGGTVTTVTSTLAAIWQSILPKGFRYATASRNGEQLTGSGREAGNARKTSYSGGESLDIARLQTKNVA